MKLWAAAVSTVVTLPLVIEFCGDDVLDQGSYDGVLWWRIWTKHSTRFLASTTASWFGPNFLVLFHGVVSFYYLIIVALSLFISWVVCYPLPYVGFDFILCFLFFKWL